MLDNAANNDTFVDGIERRAKKAGMPFNASWARLRCMPHTIHLAAVKVPSILFFNNFLIYQLIITYLSSSKGLVQFQAQKARKLHLVLVTTKMQLQHYLTVDMTTMRQLRMMAKVTQPYLAIP